MNRLANRVSTVGFSRRQRARRLRDLTAAAVNAAHSPAAPSGRPIEALEVRWLLASDIMVEIPGTGGTTSTELHTYTPTGTAVGFPIPIFAQPGSDGPPRGFAVDPSGNIQIFDGTATPVLLTITTPTDKFTDHTATVSANNGDPIGWSMGNLPYAGGLAVFGQDIIVPDELTTGKDTRGLIEFDSATNYTTSEIESDATNTPLPGINFINVSVGQDGTVYALTATGTVREYNLAGNFLNQLTLPGTNQTSVTGDSMGNIFVGTATGGMYKLDPMGNILQHFAYNATDLAISSTNELLAVSGGNIAILDTNLNIVSSFQVPDPTGADFAAFATYQGTGTPTPTPTPTPTGTQIIGDPLVIRTQTDGNVGQLYVYTGGSFTQPGTPNEFSFYSDSGAGNFITPVIGQWTPASNVSGNFTITGISQSIINKGIGAQTDPYVTANGAPTVTAGQTFGYIDGDFTTVGGQTTAVSFNTGSIQSSPNASGTLTFLAASTANFVPTVNAVVNAFGAGDGNPQADSAELSIIATPTPTPTPTPVPTPTPFPTPPPLPPGTTDTTPPVATLLAPGSYIGQLPVYDFRVDYTDNYATQPNSITSASVAVTAPDGSTVPVELTAILARGYAQDLATYQIPAPTELGVYTVTLQPNQIFDFEGNAAPAQTLGTFTIGNPPTQVAAGPAPDVVPLIVSRIPLAAVAGAKGSIRIKVANDGTAPLHAPVQVTLFVSPDGALDSTVTQVGQPYVLNLKIPVHKSRFVKLSFNYPQFVTAGSYHFVADFNSNNSIVESNYGNNVAVSASTVVISPPFVDLGAAFPPHRPVSFSIGHSGVETVIVTNYGNIAASGPLAIDLSAASASSTPTPSGTLIAFNHNINLAPGSSQAFRIKVPLASLGAGTYNFVADVDPTNSFMESSLSNNITTDAQPFVIQ